MRGLSNSKPLSSTKFAVVLWHILVIWMLPRPWDFVQADKIPGAIAAPESHPVNLGSVHVEKAVRASSPDNLDAYHARNALARQFQGGTAVSEPRSLQDWEMEDFVLLATVNGHLQARDRKTGSMKWELESVTPVVETTYHRQNNTKDTKDQIEDDNLLWIVEPSEEGALFRYHAELGLEKTEMTMKRLVERSPIAPPGSGRIYSGHKQTETYAIDGRTGNILRIFRTGGGLKTMVDTSRCKSNQADELEDECDSKESDITILVARTVYIVTVEDVNTNELLWTLKYSEWGPNNSDLDLASQYREPMDNRYIYAIHDGRILGFDRSRGGSLPVYTHVLDSPVARVFDVVRSASTDKTTFLVLPQPFVAADRPPQEQAKTYVGCTDGGWYALSEMSYPFVSERASPADCYLRKPKLARLPQQEKEKVIIGIHNTQHYSSPAGPASIWGQQPLLIAAPTEQNYLDKPKSSESTDKAIPSAPSTSVKRLRMTNKWNIAFAIPFLAGFLYLWVNAPRFFRVRKWNFDLNRSEPNPVVTIEGKSSARPLPLVNSVAVMDLGYEVEDGKPAVLVTQAIHERAPREEVPAAPDQDVEVVEDVSEDVDFKINEIVKVTPVEDTPPSEEIMSLSPEDDAHLLGKIYPTAKETCTFALQDIDSTPEVVTQRVTSVLQEPAPAELDIRAVRFDDERSETISPEPGEETETPTLTPTPPTPKKKKAHRGQRGGKNKKKANKSQQVEDRDEIGRIVDRAKDLQQSIALQPDVKVLNDPTDIDSDIIRIDNLEVHQDPQSTLGLGSQGTVVFKGKFEGRAVAVKRMLKTFFDVAHREVKLLQDSDDHPNVIRYHCMKELDQFLYIALEQCRASLCDVVVEPKHEDLRRLLDPKQVLKQIVSGVNHLHQMKIVHRDLKPQNILVSEPKRFPRDPSKVQHPRILISDFGLCKQLEANQSSFRATTAHAAGTSGWRAPELLMDEGSDMRPFSSSTLSETSGGSSTETILFDGLTNRRATRAIDVFSMGCVFFFVLTQGGHPFGAMKYSREMNVITGSYDLTPLDILEFDGILAKDLIRKMVQRQPKLRPDTHTIMMHPYFWTPERRLLFLIDSSDRFEKEKDLEKDGKYKSPHINALERDAVNVVKTDWLKKIDRAFYEEVMGNKRRGYDGEKVLDLLRVIRNKRNHYQDMSKTAQQSLGALPEGFLGYFTRRFPDLFLHIYRVNIETGFASKDLQAYYSLIPDL